MSKIDEFQICSDVGLMPCIVLLMKVFSLYFGTTIKFLIQGEFIK